MAHTRSNDQALKSLGAELASLKGVNTAQMIKSLCRLTYSIPASISDHDKNFLRIGILVQEMSILQKIVHMPSHLEHTRVNIQRDLSELAKSRSTEPFQKNYQEQFQPLNAKASEYIHQREQLIHAADISVKEMKDLIQRMIQHILENKPITTIQTQLDQLDKKRRDLQTQAEKLNKKEIPLQQMLDSLHNDTYKTAAAAGIKTPAPATPLAATPTQLKNE